MNKPLIAAVNGIAVGGGFELALSCDLILASTTAQFGLPEINAGTIADAASIKLPRRMPYHVAMELLLTGRFMDADEAHRWGIVNEVLQPGRTAGARLGTRSHARKRPTIGVRGHQGSRSRSREPARTGCAQPGDETSVSDGGPALRQRRPRGRARAHSPRNARLPGRAASARPLGRVGSFAGAKLPTTQAPGATSRSRWEFRWRETPTAQAPGATSRSRWEFRWRETPTAQAPGATSRSRWEFRWRETPTAQAPGAMLSVALEVSLARNSYDASSWRDLTVALEVSLARNSWPSSRGCLACHPRRPWWDRASLRHGTGQARPLCREHRRRTRAPAVFCRDGRPVNSPRLERQYRGQVSIAGMPAASGEATTRRHDV